MHLPPNHVLAGKYRLSRQLGQGGMGSVWLAEHLTLRSPVAVKLIEPSIATNPEALARFLREAQAAAALRSPHVVQILDHGVDGDVPFIVMEVLEGESLATRLSRLQRLSPAATAKIMTDVGRAMTRAHEAGVVHRDLKPDNIYIVHNDEDELAKVLDFGVAKSSTHGLGAAASSSTRTGAMLGTPYYMSPEQIEGTKTLDQRTDIWAMGVIAWECLLGSQPFDAETLGGLLLAICTREMPVPSRKGPVPPGFDAWFARACSRDPAARFSTAKEAATELRRVCGDPALAARAPSLGPGATVPWMPATSASGYAPATSAASPPLSRTTSNLNVSAPPRQTSNVSGVLVGVLALFGVAIVGVVGTVLVLHHRSAPENSTAATELLPSAAPPAAVAPSPSAPAATDPTVAASAAAPAVPSAAPSAQRVVPPSAAVAPVHLVTPSSARSRAPETKLPPRPALPGPTSVNLGI